MYFIVSLLLFITGAFVGSIVCIPCENISLLSDVFSSLATGAAALAAFKALSTWQNQKRYEEVLKELSGLEASLEVLKIKYLNYINKTVIVIPEHRNIGSSMATSEYNSYELALCEYHKSWFLMEKVLYTHELFLFKNLKDQYGFEIDPESIRLKLKGFSEMCFSGDLENINRSLSEARNEAIIYFDSCYEMLKDARRFCVKLTFR